MATVDSLTSDIAQATTRLAELRQQGAEQAIVDEAKKSLGELKKSLALLTGAGGSKDAGKKKERLLLKTAKGTSKPVFSHFLTNTFNTMESPTLSLSKEKPSISQDDHLPRPVLNYIQPPRWWRYRQVLREYAAEFVGVMILIIFGDGVVCQVVLSANSDVSTPKGEYLSISFGWAVGVATALWISAGISGGHLNPAVTLAMATFRGFPWKKVPGYIFAQMMGGVVGGGIVYANYIHAIDIVEGGRHIRTMKTAGLFSTYALDYMTNVSCFFSEFMASAVLLIVVLAVTDKKNAAPPVYLLPLALFILILGIGACLGMETGYAINPARDLGPRLLTSMVGYGSQVYTFRNHYWLWCPVMGSIIGCQAGAFLYDFFLYNGPGGLFNKWTALEDPEKNIV